LPAEEELVGLLVSELKKAAVFQKEGPLLRQEDLERRDVETQRVYIDIGEIRINREIRNQVASQPILEIEAAAMQSLRALFAVRPEASQHVRLDEKQAAAADFPEVRELSSLGDTLQAVDPKVGAPKILLVFPSNESKEIDAQ